MRDGQPVSDEDLAIGACLAAARISAGLSQRQAAARLSSPGGPELPQSRIGKLETGARRLLFSEAVAFARLYGVTLDDLVPDAARGNEPEPERD